MVEDLWQILNQKSLSCAQIKHNLKIILKAILCLHPDIVEKIKADRIKPNEPIVIEELRKFRFEDNVIVIDEVD